MLLLEGKASVDPVMQQARRHLVALLPVTLFQVGNPT